METFRAHWRWIIPLLLCGGDAHAWGLYTHVYFAQQLIWAIPLMDKRCYRAIKDFPSLVLAGACLPDLSLVCKRFGLDNLENSHHWQNPHELLRNADGEAECAMALGYTSHLWVDVIAHNHFVPAHEKMWADIPLLTHAASEWAMDHYICRQLYRRPADLLRRHERELAQYVCRHFGGGARAARGALALLAGADAALRQSGIPQLCFRTAQTFDRGLQRRFNYYLNETSSRLRQINRVLGGETPEWLAEPPCATARERMDCLPRLKLRHRVPLPRDYFADAEG